MVMKKNAMRKNLRQSILNSLGRYIAIVAIIALGAGLFVGLLMTKTDMVATGNKFMQRQNMFDLRLMSSYAWGEEHLEAISNMEGVQDAEGIIYVDVIVNVNQNIEEKVYRFYSMPEQINRLVLKGGRMPQTADECVIDGFLVDDEILGSTLTVTETNSEDTIDAMVYKTYTIVGYVSSPLYMDRNRGTTGVGSGELENLVFVSRDGFDVDYYSEIHVTTVGEYTAYTDEYHDAMDAMAEAMEPEVQILAEDRLVKVRNEATKAYQDGMQEYLDGVQELEEGKAEAKAELADAYEQLMDAEQQIEDNEKLLEDGLVQIQEGKETLKEGEQTLLESKQTLANAKATAYKEISKSTTQLLTQFESLTKNLTNLQNEMTALQTQSLTLSTTIMQMELEVRQIDSQISLTNSMIGILDTSISSTRQSLELAKQNGADEQAIAQMEQELQELQNTRAGYMEQLTQQQKARAEAEAKLQPYYAQQEKLQAEQNALNNQITQTETAMTSLTENLLALSATQAVMDAEFAVADAQIEAGEAQIEAAYLELEKREQEITDGKIALEEAKEELKDGWQEYYDGKAEAEQEIADAEAELADGKKNLDDAKEIIDGMTETTVFILNRTSNMGYNSLESGSDIVQGVSRVLPAFFLLIAALVCITTMTRMIDEERTQIGTLKALGYSNSAIISKYMLYAGSGALVGCGLGVLAGSVLFPVILWQAYKNMLYIAAAIVLRFNWVLCFLVVATYVAAMLMVTWYCCRRTLEEVPAELIRPRSPEAGKKIFMEYLPIWHKISFLNKVAIRNIFRYRQRMAMMLVGIGGCTALLLTGFGLRDSIVNIVDLQFEEVTTYDMQVYFTDEQTEEEKENFLKEADVPNLMFYHQESVEIEFDDHMREVYLMAAGEKIQEFIDFHQGKKQVEMPGIHEVLLTVGVAEAMEIEVGDQIQLRNTDMEVLELTVSGIYDNNVYNYAVVLPETLEAQWGTYPGDQMALVMIGEDQDPYAVSAHLSGLDHVMNVSVSEDLAGLVGSMMEAMNMMVWVIVFCAGLLATIVLYNLTNININERIREIATIKVLGFNAGETGAYVFKENLVLSVMGAVLGLPMGYMLLDFVMSQIKIDICWFQPRVLIWSYVLSLALTLLAAFAVDVIFYHKLDRINMAEALKSVE